jgi:3-deoxy-D-manno-octulosonic-acid transferase
VAYVGGSFKQGIHNVLEPAVYGIPVIFGPKIEYSLEAKELVKRGASQVVTTSQEANTVLTKLFDDDKYRNEIGSIASAYVNENLGASEKIILEIEKYL